MLKEVQETRKIDLIRFSQLPHWWPERIEIAKLVDDFMMNETKTSAKLYYTDSGDPVENALRTINNTAKGYRAEVAVKEYFKEKIGVDLEFIDKDHGYFKLYDDIDNKNQPDLKDTSTGLKIEVKGYNIKDDNTVFLDFKPKFGSITFSAFWKYKIHEADLVAFYDEKKKQIAILDYAQMRDESRLQNDGIVTNLSKYLLDF